VPGCLLKPQQAFYEIGIRPADHSLLIEGAFAFLRFLGKNVTFERLLVGNFARAGHFKPLFGTRIGLNLWHFGCFLDDTLLADPHRRTTYGAVWVNKWSAKVVLLQDMTKSHDVKLPVA